MKQKHRKQNKKGVLKNKRRYILSFFLFFILKLTLLAGCSLEDECVVSYLYLHVLAQHIRFQHASNVIYTICLG